MQSLKDNFKELLERIRYGREIGHAGFEPIYYLIFNPSQILEVKRQLPAWTAKLQNDGWKVYIFSMAECIINIHRTAKVRKIWLSADSKSPLEWEKTNESLTNALLNGSLETALFKQLSELDSQENSILLITDLEALHPYIRIGAIESKLQGKFSVPTIILYPGERTGKTGLKFLNFYPEDGNYRSVHVGG